MEDKVLFACQVQRLSAVLADSDLVIKAFLMATSLYLVVLGGLTDISIVLKYFVVCVSSTILPGAGHSKVNCPGKESS